MRRADSAGGGEFGVEYEEPAVRQQETRRGRMTLSLFNALGAILNMYHIHDFELRQAFNI